MTPADFDTIFIAGPQGCGKGTQGKRLAAKLGFVVWDMGAILREIIKEGGPLAEKVSVINNGTFLTDDVIIEVINTKVSGIPVGRGIIFDGVPRRIGQAQFLLQLLRDQKRKKVVTVFMDIPRQVSLDRLISRAKIEGRMDDTPEGITARLDFYEEVIRPTMEYLKGETTFVNVDGTPSIDEVEKSIDVALGIV